jgi:hypothetical protein
MFACIVQNSTIILEICSDGERLREKAKMALYSQGKNLAGGSVLENSSKVGMLAGSSWTIHDKALWHALVG